MISGTPKFNALALYELSATIKPTLTLKSKLGFVNVRTGDTHGWSTAEGAVWSKATLDALSQLVAAMEKDLGELHLQVDGGPTQANPANGQPGLRLGGIAEHLDGEPTPQF